MRHFARKHGWGKVLAILSSTAGAAAPPWPAVESFETPQALAFYQPSGGALRLSRQHRRFGQYSLEWEWHGPAQFGTGHFRLLSREESPLKYGSHFPSSPSLSMSVYNETAQPGSVRISYESHGEPQVWFDLPLDFQGWRQVWVPFHEMQGKAPKKGEAVAYDYFRVSTSALHGKLYFDDIIFSQFQDDRHAYPDRMVPFIKAGQTAAADHWMPMLDNLERLDRLAQARPAPLSSQAHGALQRIEAAIDAELSPDAAGPDCSADARRRFARLKLSDQGASVLGPPLTFQVEQDHFDPAQQGDKEFNDIRDFGIALKQVAACRRRASPAEQVELDRLLVDGARYFLDQGWQAGSSGGTRHHIGYQTRELTEAFYLGRETLRRAGLLEQVGRSLQWLTNLGMVLDDAGTFHVNLDYLHTQSYVHLMLIFMGESRAHQAALLAAYARYLSVTLAQQHEEWGFKPDGTAWHHNGHYPAYGLGAFKTVPKIIRHLSGTPFRLSPEAHANFKLAFLSTRGYSQGYDIGFGNAGRHPFSDLNSIRTLKTPYLDLALAGSPDGKSAVDPDVAAAYVRLWGRPDELAGRLPGLAAEQLPAYATWPYAATAVQRGKDWAAIIKGYSQYVWSSEIYLDENRYGRYAANGTIQLLGQQGEAGSGFRQDGWDWNRYPGATAIELPYHELEPDQPLLMFRSRESFAGAVRQGDNGAFGLILNEGSGSNADGDLPQGGFPGKLRARKSVLSFGDKLICIGTNISSADTGHPVLTTLFQSALNRRDTALRSSQGDLGAFPYRAAWAPAAGGERWLLDPVGNAYHVLAGGPLHIRKDVQQSYRNTYSVRTGKSNARAKGVTHTAGDFASAWIDHGQAPAGASYQYVIYPQASARQVRQLGARGQAQRSYAILRADGVAHIVRDKPSATTAYVVFEAAQPLGPGLLASTSAPSLVMVRDERAGGVTLSAVQPDLNFEERASGRYQNASRPVRLALTMNGLWRATRPVAGVTLRQAGGKTVIEMTCKDGMPVEVRLAPQAR